MSEHPCTGIYVNESTQQYEAWVVNLCTNEEEFLGACDIAGDLLSGGELRRLWETRVWTGLLRRLGAEI